MKTLSDVDANILKAAEEQFARHGFHGTVVRDIASDADVGKGTVYRHFGNKKELFGSLVEHATGQLIDILEDIVADRLSPEDRLRAILEAHFNFFETKHHLVEIIVKEGIQRTGDEIDSVIDKWETYRGIITDVFKRIQRNESGLSVSNPEIVSHLYLSWIWGVLRDRIIFGYEASIETYGDQMFDLFVEGMDSGD